jgi:hypothetical protein
LRALSRSRLKVTAQDSALFSGFAVVALVEIDIQEGSRAGFLARCVAPVAHRMLVTCMQTFRRDSWLRSL